MNDFEKKKKQTNSLLLIKFCFNISHSLSFSLYFSIINQFEGFLWQYFEAYPIVFFVRIVRKEKIFLIYAHLGE